MKRFAFLASVVVYGLSTLAAAQTLAQNFAAQIAEMSSRIAAAQLSVELKNDFNNKLAQVSRDAGCFPSPDRRGQSDCSRSTPQQIEAAGPKIVQLGRDVDLAVKEFGDKPLRIVYETKLRDLSTRVSSSKVIEPEKTALQARIKDFFRPYAPGSLRDSAASVMEQEYQRLIIDLDAAIRLSAESSSTKPFFEQYRSKVDALVKRIAESKLNPATKNDLQRALTDLATPILGSTLGGKALPNRTPSEIADANAKLGPFSQRVDSMIAAGGEKSLADMMTPRLDAAEKKLREAKLDGPTSQNLLMRIEQLRRTLRASAGEQRDSNLKGGGGVSLGQFEAALAALNADIDAAIALYASRGNAATIVAAFSKKMSDLDAKIIGSRLDRFLANFYAEQAVTIFREGCETFGQPVNMKAPRCELRTADASNIAMASSKADALNAVVDEAIKNFGDKPLSTIYKERADNVKKSLLASKLTSRDQTQLIARVDTFIGRLGRGTAGRGETPETIERDWRIIIADVEAALRLAGGSSSPPAK